MQSTPIAQASGNDWNTVNNWNPFGLSASGSEASYPGSTYELKAGERLRTPAGTSLNVFPGNRLTVDGSGIFENGTLNYVAELRLKCGTGLVTTNFFPELVLSGGQIDNGGQSAPLGDLQVVQGRITVSSNSAIYVDSVAGYDRGYRLEAWLTGSGNLLWHQYSGSLGGTNLQIACVTNTFNGQWVVDQGVLLGSATNSLGTNNIIIGTNGLIAAVETLYDIHNTNGNLVLGANGKVFLHQNNVFGGVNLNGTSLAAGVYTFAQLNATNSAMFPASWAQQNGSSVSSGSGSITVIGTNGVDSDGNGLLDAWEIANFGHIGIDPSADPDGDGLTNLQEYQAGTNPIVDDSMVSSSRLNYSYDVSDWLEGISGVRTGSVSLDNEGNVLSVSQ